MNRIAFKNCIICITRKQFPFIVKAAYHFIMERTKEYLRTPLESTGLPPHFCLTADKSTPHMETNHAVLVILPVEGKRVALPIDAPCVYGIEEDDWLTTGGPGEDLADQISQVLLHRLCFESEDLHFVEFM